MMMRRPTTFYSNQSGSQGCGLNMGRIVIGLIIAAVAIVSFLSSKSYNPVTGQDQYVSITPEQEIALGLQAEPDMLQQYGGEDTDPNRAAQVQKVGARLLQKSEAAQTQWQFQFHLLNDDQTVNAFALPGGQVFITDGLYDLLKTEGQLAGVLGHEMGHVLARHGAQQLAQSQLTDGLIGAVAVAAANPNDPNGANAAQIAQVVGQLVNLKYSRADESQADTLGVRLMSEAGYDPNAMVQVQQILEQLSQSGQPPEFLSDHPDPANRITNIQAEIQKEFPNGVPSGMTP
jgi:beta-barrel assembly-enhancing protease